jgi:competence protein ComEA
MPARFANTADPPTRGAPPPERPGESIAPGESTAPLPVPPRFGGRLGELVDRWVPAAWRRVRLDPGRPGAVALALVAATAAVLAALGVWRDRPVAESPPALTAAGTTGSGPGAPAGSPAVGSSPVGSAAGGAERQPAGGGALVVSVAGKVRRPGLVRLPDGSRVADAIVQAGGPLPRTDLTALNLARRVVDGEQILVGVPPPAGADAWMAGNGPAGAASATGGAPQPGGGRQPGGKVDLNRATVEQLDALPGIGPVTAQRILDWRTRHGRFSSVDQLREIDGIGERRLAQLRDQVTV